MRRSTLVAAGVSFLLVVAAAATHVHWLGALGRSLVQAEPPQRAELIVVLAGDWWGNRILKAGELVRQGYAPQALVSGPDGAYGYHECDLAIPFAVRHGYPESWFLHLHIRARSTREEAQAVLAELRRRRVRSVLIVTSDYHTRRAGAIYRSLAPAELQIRVVAAPDAFFRPDRWWQTREGRKQWVLESLKTVSDWFGL
ncbi:MAG: YdcF family protein [Bryobacterales bacterium]|nr:YdcF family protein [Bryobacteraceae bacterium]MDW8354044.1 YdcF family protein [Bryobacterales bacterium]